jgi:membrane protease YdiL (CAAX protease family)
LFGAVHLFGGAQHALFAFIVGLPLCWLYVAAGSLWAPVFAHRTVNTVGLTLMWAGS